MMPSRRRIRATSISPTNRQATAPSEANARNIQASWSPPRAVEPKSIAALTRYPQATMQTVTPTASRSSAGGAALAASAPRACPSDSPAHSDPSRTVATFPATLDPDTSSSHWWRASSDWRRSLHDILGR